MRVKNNTDAPQVQINWKHIFLVVLHFVVFVFLAFSQDFTTQVAAKALPQALQVGSLAVERPCTNP
jgi:preprotein translocase subunit YajC